MSTHIERSALLPYSAEQLFELVNDVEAYPQYMDGCVAAQVLSSDEGGMEARLELKKGGISQSFATRNHWEEHSQIVMELLEGPFESLHGVWNFNALASDACKVSLDLRFTMNNQLVSKAAERLFESVAGNLVNALCQRANCLYGS